MLGKWLKFLALPCLLFFAMTQTVMAQYDDSLAPQAGSLNAIVVTASSFEESAKEVTSNITVITAQDIEKSTARNLNGLLAKYGFQVYDLGAKSVAYIRGIGGSSMQSEMETTTFILLNGHRVGSNDLSLQMLTNVERVEIIRGPAAMQYGAAIAGVINIITKKGQQRVFTTNLQVGAGSFGLIDQSLSFTGGTNGWDFSIGASHSSRGDYKISGNKTFLRTAWDNKLGFDLDVGYTFLDNHRIGVNLYYAKIGGLELPVTGYEDAIGYPHSFRNYDTYLYNTTITYTGSTNDKMFSWLAEYTFGQDDSVGNTFYDQLYPFYTGIDYPYRTDLYATRLLMDQAKAQLTFDKDIVTLTVGIDWLQYKYSVNSLYGSAYWAPSKSYNKHILTDFGIYLLAKVRLINDRLILSASGRYDTVKSEFEGSQISKKSTNFSPSVGAAFLVTDYLKLRANYTQGFKMPSPMQYLGDGNWYIPNLNVNPEKSQTYEFGADFSYEYIDATFTYFHTDRIGAILSHEVDPINFKYQYYNIKKATIAGFEVGFRFDIGQMLEQDFSLAPYFNFTWITTRKHREDEPEVPTAPQTLPYVPELMASYGIDFDHPGIGTSARLNFTYIGQRYAQFFGDAAAQHKNRTWHNYGGATVVDLGIKQRLWDTGDKGQFYAKAEINNIFDTNIGQVLDYPMAGRNFYLAVGYEY
jgi:vitamin B12 transporter